MAISERSVGEDEGEFKDCVINDLRLPIYVFLTFFYVGRGSRRVLAGGL